MIFVLRKFLLEDRAEWDISMTISQLGNLLNDSQRLVGCGS